MAETLDIFCLFKLRFKSSITQFPMHYGIPEDSLHFFFPTRRAGGCPEEAVTLWEAHAGAGSWQDLWPHGERSPGWSRFANSTCDPTGDSGWSSLFLKDCTPWKGPTLERFMKNCSVWEGLTLEKLMENCLLWGSPQAGGGEVCEESSP